MPMQWSKYQFFLTLELVYDRKVDFDFRPKPNIQLTIEAFDLEILWKVIEIEYFDHCNLDDYCD